MAGELDPTIGAEIQKTRPALIIQNDIGNRVSEVTIVAAITSTLKKPYPFQVEVVPPEGGLAVHSVITLNHIRSIDRRRLIRKLGLISDATMSAVDRALIVSLAINVA